jgi:NADH-ubiquinone oxidoreductase chain 2
MRPSPPRQGSFQRSPKPFRFLAPCFAGSREPNKGCLQGRLHRLKIISYHNKKKKMFAISLLIIIIVTSISSLTQYSRKYINRLVIVSLLYSVIISMYNFPILNTGDLLELTTLNGLIHINSLTTGMDIVILLIGCIIIYIGSSNALDKDELKYEYILQTQTLTGTSNTMFDNQTPLKLTTDYTLIALFSLLGGSLLLSSNNLMLVMISIELQSYSLYILATINKDSNTSTGAGLKYFLVGGIASVLILLGIACIYVAFGSFSLSEIYSMIEIYNSKNINSITSMNYDTLTTKINNWFYIGFLLMYIGFIFKIGAAPFHSWTADVYDGVPTIVTAWFSTFTKIAILVFLISVISNVGELNYLNTLNTTFNTSINYPPINNLLIIFAICSMFIGSFGGLDQYRLKRLVAFSGFTNIGYILLTLILGNKSVFAFYLIQYTISTLNLFLIIIMVGYILYLPNSSQEQKNNNTVNNYVVPNYTFDHYSPIEYIVNLQGLIFKYPYLGYSLAITLFSFIGIPPLIGFYGKYYIIFNAIKDGYVFTVTALILASVISSFYYLKIIKVLTSETNSDGENKNSIILWKPLVQQSEGMDGNPTQVTLSRSLSYIIIALTCIQVFFFIEGDLILEYLNIILSGTHTATNITIT